MVPNINAPLSGKNRIKVSLDMLVQYCGYFDSVSDVNNGYNCNHQNPPDAEFDRSLNREVGKCTAGDCPVANLLYEEDGYEEAQRMMEIFDAEVQDRMERLAPGWQK